MLPGNSTSITPWLRVIHDPTISHSAYFLPSWFKSFEETTRTPFAILHEKEIFDLADVKPEFTKLFNEGMASDAGLVMDVVVMSCGDVFEGVESLVDDGGGNGTTAMALKKAFPEMKCIVFDLPHVIQGKEVDGVAFVAGDFFRIRSSRWCRQVEGMGLVSILLFLFIYLFVLPYLPFKFLI
ncbi:putative O-methyltransferase domain, S-adenosyl-L-methionine-dependent methyltransferase [Dioscorea sansibarensis]